MKAAPRNAPAGHFPPVPHTGDRYRCRHSRLLRAGRWNGFSIMKTSLAFLVVSLGLGCAGAFAKPNASAPVDSQNFEKYKAKAQTGDTEAQIALGTCYTNGTGTPKNDAEAVAWFRKAAETGHAEAQYALGVCYNRGTGITRDDAEAVKWYRKSAEQGHAEAQYQPGV